ncbi:MAG TPA: outer membrane lipoprotein carrier protein LolA [Kofleriaceae bacterium]|jgi:outer membrane lipoprotein carrier protein
MKLLSLAILAATATTASAAPTADEVVDQVQQFYKGIDQVTAKFQETALTKAFNHSDTSQGLVSIAKPGKMRWDYYAKDNHQSKTFVSNGKMLYLVDNDNLQIVKKDISKDLMPVAVSFLMGTGDLRAQFTPALDTSKTYGTSADLVLKLTPKEPSATYKNLYLVVNPANYRVTESVIIDSSDDVTDIKFYEPDFKTPIKAGIFEFNPATKPKYQVLSAAAAAGAAPKAP